MKRLVMVIFWAAVAIVLSTSCRKAEDSSDVNQDKIYAYYELKYDENKDQTYAYARFHFGTGVGGTPLQLGTGSDVTVDGNAMTWNGLVNHYEKTFTGKQTTATFVFTDLDNNTFTNSATIRDIGLPTNLPDTIARDAAYSLSWTGNPIAADEAVWAYAKGDGELDDQIFKTSDVGATFVSLAKSQLEKLDDGLGKIWISRRVSNTVTQGSSNGGDVVSIYLTDSKNVYFK